MHTHGHPGALWAGGLKTAAGFALTLALLLIVNVFVYQKMRQFTVACPEPLQADELLRILVVTDLFAIVFLTTVVLLLNRQLTVRAAAGRAAKRLHAEEEARLHDRLDELTNANRVLQADQTERRRFEEQLKRFQKLESLGRLVGGVGHEFNNYLTVILGFSEQLLQQLPPETTEHATVVEIYKAGERSAELTRGLLGLARPGDGAPRPIDVNRQVHALGRMLNVLVGKRVRLEVALQDNLPSVTAAPGQVEQVLLNLAANARDAMPDGGRLSIETRAIDLTAPSAGLPPGRYVLLTVADTGSGLSDEVRRRMFEAFYTTKPQGTGLGLATVRDIVYGGGGAVVADNPPGQGTTFKVYWPALPADAQRDTISQGTPGERETLRG